MPEKQGAASTLLVMAQHCFRRRWRQQATPSHQRWGCILLHLGRLVSLWSGLFCSGNCFIPQVHRPLLSRQAGSLPLVQDTAALARGWPWPTPRDKGPDSFLTTCLSRVARMNLSGCLPACLVPLGGPPTANLDPQLCVCPSPACPCPCSARPCTAAVEPRMHDVLEHQSPHVGLADPPAHAEAPSHPTCTHLPLVHLLPAIALLPARARMCRHAVNRLGRCGGTAPMRAR